MATHTRPPRLADVAARAGVSGQTVSRVLNGERWVAEETKARVLEAAEELGYRPNRAARTLARGRSRTLGVVGLDEALYNSVSPLISFDRAARAAGYHVTIVSASDMREASMVAALDTLAEHAVEGVLVIAPEDEAVEGLRRFPVRVPTVAVEAAARAGVTTIGLDQQASARLAVEHLLALGHTRIGHLHGPRTRLEGRLRLRGWRAALRRAGLPAPEPWPGDWSLESGYAAGERFLASRRASANGQEPPTAVFVASDRMALGFVRALHEARVRVPEDVSVVGFDDVPEAAFAIPALTTVRQDFAAVGRGSLELLLARMASPDEPPTRHVVPTELVVRESTAAPLRL